jgi:hypothetical protein
MKASTAVRRTASRRPPHGCHATYQQSRLDHVNPAALRDHDIAVRNGNCNHGETPLVLLLSGMGQVTMFPRVQCTHPLESSTSSYKRLSLSTITSY